MFIGHFLECSLTYFCFNFIIWSCIFTTNDKIWLHIVFQVHPQGWCVLSRNISNDENSEWTCVHDIQEPAKSTGSGSEEGSEAGGGGGGSGGGVSEDEEEEEEDDTLLVVYCK